MRVSAISYLVFSIVVFAISFGIQALIVPYFLPAPTIEDLGRPLEVTGTYTYFDGARSSQSAVTVDGMKFYCGTGALSSFTCLKYTHGLPQRTSVTVQFVNLKSLFGHIAVAMSIKSSSGAKIFSQKPIQFIKTWKSENLFWFSVNSLILVIVVVGATRIYLTRSIMV